MIEERKRLSFAPLLLTVFLAAAMFAGTSGAQYSLSALLQWKDLTTAHVLMLPGVTVSGVDEANNRVRIGVESKDAEGAIVAELSRWGIPFEAVEIEVTGPVILESLRAFHRPLVGGLQIHLQPFGADFRAS